MPSERRAHVCRRRPAFRRCASMTPTYDVRLQRYRLTSTRPSSERRLTFSPVKRPTDTGWESSRPTAPSPASTSSSATSSTVSIASASGRSCNYLRRQQLPDGGFSIYDKGPGNLSATIKAYFAMKVGGVSPDDPAMVAARAPASSRGAARRRPTSSPRSCSRSSASTTGRASRRCPSRSCCCHAGRTSTCSRCPTGRAR